MLLDGGVTDVAAVSDVAVVAGVAVGVDVDVVVNVADVADVAVVADDLAESQGSCYDQDHAIQFQPDGRSPQ